MLRPDIQFIPIRHPNQIGYELMVDCPHVNSSLRLNDYRFVLGRVYHDPRNKLWIGEAEIDSVEFCSSFEEATDHVVINGAMRHIDDRKKLHRTTVAAEKRREFLHQTTWLELFVTTTLRAKEDEDNE